MSNDAARRELTTPDLVVLSLLAEQPMHGYELDQELDRREVRDWAGISRPQVYYSLRKLEGGGYVARQAGLPSAAPRGPDPRVYGVTELGRGALRDALEREDWATHRPIPAFLTWLALSSHAAPGAARRQMERRRDFLRTEMAREQATLEAIRADTGPMVAAAELMVELVIHQFAVELAWLDEVERRLG